MNLRVLIWAAAIVCFSVANAFVVKTIPSTPTLVAWNPRRRAVFMSDKNVDTGEPSNDEDCPSEEECEIDWDKMMPNWDEIGTPTETESSDNSSENDDKTTPTHEPTPGPSPVHSTVTGSHEFENLRLRLEMHWQMTEAVDECDVENPPTCGSEACQTCRGRGYTMCRFCRGTSVLWMQPHPLLSKQTVALTSSSVAATAAASDTLISTLPADYQASQSIFSKCPVCDVRGHEVCRPCQGSGWISSWTKLGTGTGQVHP
jgi:hypothetical protein